MFIRKFSLGFTLFELVFVLLILIILSSLAIPAMQDFLAANEAEVMGHELFHALQFARTQALLQGMPIIVCASTDGFTCVKHWNQKYILLQNQHALAEFSIHKAHGVLHWQAFGAQQNLQISASGEAQASNGTFRYCSKRTHRLIWTIIISRTGRIRQIHPEKYVSC